MVSADVDMVETAQPVSFDVHGKPLFHYLRDKRRLLGAHE